MQKPKYITVGLRELVTLLSYAQAAAKADEIGELGEKSFDTTLAEINIQSDLKVTVEQLEHLLYVYKVCIAERVGPGKERVDNNWNRMLERLSKADPRVYKVAENGEVKLYEFGN